MKSAALLPILALLSCTTDSMDPLNPSSDGGMTMPGTDLCGGCPEGKVCVESLCQDVPRTCPCPKETYCDLGTGTCKIGCTDDSHCSSGRRCDAATRRCQRVCQRDMECVQGEICDETTRMCRPGCRRDSDCHAPQQSCDRRTFTCKGGEGTACMDHDDCALGNVCDPMTRRCVAGCNRNRARCPEGQACVPQNDGSSRCQVACRGLECNGDGFTCYHGGMDSKGSMCRKMCRADTECPDGERCTDFALDPRVPFLTPIALCARPCDVAGCASAVDPAGSGGLCRCDAMARACVTSDRTRCYQIRPDYGL